MTTAIMSSDDLVQRLLDRPAKTGTETSVIEHASHVLQVLRWMLGSTHLPERSTTLLALAAALHDTGKAVTDPSGSRWAHSEASADLIPKLLADPRFRDALAAADLRLNLSDQERADLQHLCREHHGLTGPTLTRVPGAPLLVAADALASALEEGYSGRVRSILFRRYQSIAVSTLETLGLAPWLDEEIHSLSLPSDTMSDLLLSEKVIDTLVSDADSLGLSVVLRAPAQLWVAGPRGRAEDLLSRRISTSDVLDVRAMYDLYTRHDFPRVPQVDIPVLEYLFSNDEVALLVIQDLFLRRSADFKEALDAHAFSYNTLTHAVAPHVLSDPIALGELVYLSIRDWTIERLPSAAEILPVDHMEWIGRGANTADDQVRTLVPQVAQAPDVTQQQAAAILGLIRRRAVCRSVSNAVREYVLVQRHLDERSVSFSVRDVAVFDTALPDAAVADTIPGDGEAIGSTTPCAACGLRPAAHPSSALLRGATYGDGLWASAGRRKRTHLCSWCHTSAVADLPMASLRVWGGVRKQRDLNYLLVETLLSRENVAMLLHELGHLSREEASTVMAPSPSEAPLAQQDVDLFTDILTTVPEPSHAVGVEGILGSLPVQRVVGQILPGRVPLATTIAFSLLPSSLFGTTSPVDLNSEVLEIVSLGLAQTLHDRLGAARFRVRTRSNAGTILHTDFQPGTPDARRAQAILGLAELRRRHLANESTGQEPDQLSVSWILDLLRNPLDEVSRLIREISAPGAAVARLDACIRDICAFADQIVPPGNDPYQALLHRMLQHLMNVRVLGESHSAFAPARRSGGRHRLRTHAEVMGPLAAFANTASLADFDAWVRVVRTQACSRVRDPGQAQARWDTMEALRSDVLSTLQALDVSYSELRTRLFRQAWLGVYVVSRARSLGKQDQNRVSV